MDDRDRAVERLTVVEGTRFPVVPAVIGVLDGAVAEFAAPSRSWDSEYSRGRRLRSYLRNLDR